MNNEHIFIVRCGEVALKGMNKPYFERMLVERIKKLLKKFDGVSVKRHEGLIFVRADKSLDKQAIIKEISKVFGVASISPAVECESTMEADRRRSTQGLQGAESRRTSPGLPAFRRCET